MSSTIGSVNWQPEEFDASEYYQRPNRSTNLTMKEWNKASAALAQEWDEACAALDPQPTGPTPLGQCIAEQVLDVRGYEQYKRDMANLAPWNEGIK